MLSVTNDHARLHGILWSLLLWRIPPQHVSHLFHTYLKPMPGPRKYQRILGLSNEHTKGIASVAFSPEGSYIATAGLDGKVCWWRMEDGELLYVWTGNSAILSLAWVPGREDSIICGLQDGNVGMLQATSVCLHPHSRITSLFLSRTHCSSSDSGRTSIL